MRFSFRTNKLLLDISENIEIYAKNGEKFLRLEALINRKN